MRFRWHRMVFMRPSGVFSTQSFFSHTPVRGDVASPHLERHPTLFWFRSSANSTPHLRSFRIRTAGLSPKLNSVPYLPPRLSSPSHILPSPSDQLSTRLRCLGVSAPQWMVRHMPGGVPDGLRILFRFDRGPAACSSARWYCVGLVQ